MTNGKEPMYPVAYPTAGMGKELNGKVFAGLSKREYFAAMFAQGCLTLDVSGAARLAVQFADALIAELERGRK